MCCLCSICPTTNPTHVHHFHSLCYLSHLSWVHCLSSLSPTSHFSSLQQCNPLVNSTMEPWRNQLFPWLSAKLVNNENEDCGWVEYWVSLSIHSSQACPKVSMVTPHNDINKKKEEPKACSLVSCTKTRRLCKSSKIGVKRSDNHGCLCQFKWTSKTMHVVSVNGVNIGSWACFGLTLNSHNLDWRGWTTPPYSICFGVFGKDYVKVTKIHQGSSKISSQNWDTMCSKSLEHHNSFKKIDLKHSTPTSCSFHCNISNKLKISRGDFVHHITFWTF